MGQPARWLSTADGRIIGRGEGFPLPDGGTRIVGVVPASDVVVHQLVLPNLTDAQARGAARLAVAENSVSPIATLHVAVSASIDGERTVVALDSDRMAGYLSELGAQGLEPDVIIAAPLILDRPDIGFVVADLGWETVIRGRDGAFADDPVLTPLLTGGQVVTLDSEEVDAAIIAAATAPEVDLRQGAFVPRRRWAVDASRFRRIGWLAAGCLVTLVVSPVVELVHLNAAARHIEARNIGVAQSVLPVGLVVVDPLAQLDEQLTAVGGAGGGFLSLTDAVASASASANVEVGVINFDGSGLYFSAHATTPAELALFETRMAAIGLIVTPVPGVVGGGRPTSDYTVRVR
jgi:general secretion pathway protein L